MPALGDAIRRNRDRLLEEWSIDVSRLAQFSSPSELRDHMPWLLDRLADHLDDPVAPGDAVVLPAARHAMERLREGFDLRQVIAEYRVLRACLVRFVHEESVADLAGIQQMHRLIDDAVAESVERYSDARQRALRDSERRLQAIIDTAPLLVFLKDRAGRYLLANRSFEQVVGRRRDELVGHTDRDLFATELAARLQEGDGHVFETGETAEFEQVLSVEGEPHVWIVHKFILGDAPGAAQVLCAIGADITERKRIEEMREKFVSVLGHDLRSPLQTVIASAAALERAGDLNDIQRRAVLAIQRSGRTMNRLIQEILDFARGRLGGGIPIVPQQCQLGRICEFVVEAVRLSYPDRLVVLDAAGDLSGTWDPARLEQLVTNLVENAIQHGRDPVRVVARDGGDAVELEVSNAGDPLAPSALATLFEPFLGKREPGKGLGLGLYIVREIARAHNGHVDVRSSPAGTSFTVRLPRAAADSFAYSAMS